jgi:hypothetical protein
MKRKHPKSENILKVIKAFQKVLPLTKKEKRHLDMGEPNVNIGTECGTIHCHGGWFAVAVCDLKKGVDYIDGANEMARMLGFAFYLDLESWARDEEKIWGNDAGALMFSDSSAFQSEKRPEGAKSLQDIVDHWKEVYERVVKFEKAKRRKEREKNKKKVVKKKK